MKIENLKQKCFCQMKNTKKEKLIYTEDMESPKNNICKNRKKQKICERNKQKIYNKKRYV